jgi:hypothetical protein
MPSVEEENFHDLKHLESEISVFNPILSTWVNSDPARSGLRATGDPTQIPWLCRPLFIPMEKVDQ